MTDKIRQSEIIIKKAIENYKPSKFVLMVSGGHDSITNAHVSAAVLKKLEIKFVVYHGYTTIGIPETQRFVKDTCKAYDWELFIRAPPP